MLTTLEITDQSMLTLINSQFDHLNIDGYSKSQRMARSPFSKMVPKILICDDAPSIQH